MNFIKASLIFVLLLLEACSHSEDVVLARYDENGVRYSPATVQGLVGYLPTMEPTSVRIVNVDYQLNPVDSFEVELKNTNWSSNGFLVEDHDFEYPILKIVTVFPNGEKSKMEFSQYYHLELSNYKISQNMYMALVAGRIESLMQTKDFDFNVAEAQALQEFSNLFDVNIDKIRTFELSSYKGVDFNDYFMYLLCRHEISDSVFYSDFQKLRKDFALNGSLDSLMLVTAADAWLSTFKNVPSYDPDETTFESISRDTAVGLKSMQASFFNRAYGINLLNKGIDSVQIKKESSAFNGRFFIYDKDGYGHDFWRLKLPIEDTLGLCIASTSALVTYGGNEYLCKRGSNVWKKNVDHDELLGSFYGSCGYSNKNGDFIYVRDSLYVCECDKSDNCAWNDRYAGKEISEKDTAIYAKLIEAKAVQKFGRCYNSDYGERKILDGVYIQCIRSKWVQVDSLTYYMGHCASNNLRGKHHGAYYGCREFADYGAGDTVWAEIPAPVYRNVICDKKSLKNVEEDNGDYFICESKKVEGSDDVKYKWRKLDSAETIPPVINMDTCSVNQYNMKIAYDGEFYMCFIDGWTHVKKESLLPIEQAGNLCSIKDYGLVKGYQGTYYICNTSNQWIELNASSAAPYKYQDSLGTCDTISHKTVVWNEEVGAFYGCQTVDKKYTWGTVPMSASPNDSIPDSFDKRKFAGGVVDGDSVYTVTVDGNKYTFRRYNSNVFKWVLYDVEISGTVYDASFYKNNFFIRGKRGSENVQLNLIENKSVSFDAFYEDWKTRATDYSECSTQKAEVKDVSVLAYHFNENSYMDFAHASQFCPKGFRLLKAEEFSNSIIDITYSAMASQSVWTYEMDGGDNCSEGNLVSNFFWTSDEMDSETQKCYEDDRINTRAGSKSKKSIVDCPKDLYPMVQTLCVMDK